MIHRLAPGNVCSYQPSWFSIQRTVRSSYSITGMRFSLCARTVELPDVVVPIRVTTRAGEHGPVRGLTSIVVIKTIYSCGSFEIETNRHSFVTRFAIQSWLWWIKRVIVFDE